MKILKSLLGIALVVLVSVLGLSSCSKDDDPKGPVPGLYAVTSTELENTPSFSYSHTSVVSSAYSYTSYVWFNNGNFEFFNYANRKSDTYVLTYKYVLDGKKITLYSGDVERYSGYIVKAVDKNGDWQLVLTNSMDGSEDGTLRKEFLHWYEQDIVNLR